MNDILEGCIKLKPLRVKMDSIDNKDGIEWTMYSEMPNLYYNAKRDEIIAVGPYKDYDNVRYVDDLEPADENCTVHLPSYYDRNRIILYIEQG